MASTIVSLFDNASDAKNVVSELTQAGFAKNDINTLSGNSGNTTQALTSANVPKDAANFYQEGVRRGGSLVTLRVEDNEIDRAMEIIERHNVVDIDERATQYQSSGSTNFNMGDAARVNRGETVLPIIQEELRVGKRAVQRGGVRVYSRVTETPVEEQVTLREEHVHVDRRPVDRPIADADMAAFKEGTIELTETAEEAVVSKQARVVEEVVVGKDVQERTETVRDTVRRTDVDVEEINTTDATSTTRSKGTTNR